VTQGSSSDHASHLHRQVNQRNVSAIKLPKPGNVQPPAVVDPEMV